MWSSLALWDRFPSEQRSQATLTAVETWMGARLGIPGAAHTHGSMAVTQVVGSTHWVGVRKPKKASDCGH